MRACFFHVFWAGLCFAFSPGHSRASAPQSLPLSVYEKRGLIPRRRNTLEASSPLATTAVLTSDSTRLVTDSTSYDVDLTPASWIKNDRITITNRGSVNIVNPWVTVNGVNNWFDTPSLLAEILQGETDPLKKAFLIWRFLRDHRYHWNPAQSDIELHDPVIFLNVYGYGLCDDSACNAEALFRAAGFSAARTWGLGGHVVCEVYYANAWHMFDPDLEVFYPRADDMTVAGVMDCVNSGWLVGRVSGPDIANIYTTFNDDYTYQGYWLTDHTMAMTLRPGESLERCWSNWGKYHDNLYHNEPPIYGNGRLTWAPAPGDPAFFNGLERATNLSHDVAGNLPFLACADAARPASFVTRMQCPYPFVGGQVQCAAFAAGAADQITVEYSNDGSNWIPMGQLQGPYQGSASWPLDDLLKPLDYNAVYTFWIRVTLTGGGAATVGLNDFKIIGEIQCAPLSLPELKPGLMNHVAVSMAPGGGTLEVRHDYEYLPQTAVTSNKAVAAPLASAIANYAAPSFSWSDPTSGAQAYQVSISWDAAGVLPVSPGLWQTVSGMQSWTPDSHWLLPGKKYYFQVNAIEESMTAQFEGEAVAQSWSDTQAFNFTGIINAAKNWQRYR